MKGRFLSMLLALSLLLPLDLPAQEDIPKDVLNSVEKLSLYLCEGKNSTKDQVQAIHEWITSNIEFDYELIKNVKPSFTRKADEILKSKKAGGAEYVILMQAMLRIQLIESVLINGYTQGLPTDSVLIPIQSDHTWIAININGKWELADPTYDAGYVGYEKTDKAEKVEAMWAKHEAKFDKKFRKFEILKNSDRDDDFKEQILKAELKAQNDKVEEALKIAEKIEKMPEFKDNIVFNQEPKEEYFLIDTDTFLKDHLPLLPMWQMREDTLSIHSFMKGEKHVESRLKKKGKGNYNYRDAIDNYAKLDAFEQTAYSAEDGYDFNPMNAKIKCENNYYILRSIFTSENFSTKALKNSEGEYSVKHVFDMIDTSLKYNSIADKTAGIYFKYLNTYYKDIYKEGKGMANDEKRMMDKALAWNEKAMLDIERSWNNIERDLAKWIQNRDKMYPNTNITYSTDSFEIRSWTAIPEHHFDSLENLFEGINTHREQWRSQRHKSVLYSIDEIQFEENSMLNHNAFILNQKSFDNNEILIENNKAFEAFHKDIELMYSDSLKTEMYNKEYVVALNHFYKYVKFVNAEMEGKVSEIGVSEQRAASGMLMGHCLVQTKRFLEDLVEANRHFWWLRAELKNINNYWKKLAISSENLLVLHEDKMEYITEMLEIMETREENTLDLMKESTKNWKSVLKSGN